MPITINNFLWMWSYPVVKKSQIPDSMNKIWTSYIRAFRAKMPTILKIVQFTKESLLAFLLHLVALSWLVLWYYDSADLILSVAPTSAWKASQNLKAVHLWAHASKECLLSSHPSWNFSLRYYADDLSIAGSHSSTVESAILLLSLVFEQGMMKTSTGSWWWWWQRSQLHPNWCMARILGTCDAVDNGNCNSGATLSRRVRPQPGGHFLLQLYICWHADCRYHDICIVADEPTLAGTMGGGSRDCSTSTPHHPLSQRTVAPDCSLWPGCCCKIYVG